MRSPVMNEVLHVTQAYLGSSHPRLGVLVHFALDSCYFTMSSSSEVEQPFKVTVPDSDLELLHKKLELVRFPDELEDAGWDYGAPLADIKRLVAYWKDTFDWRKAEARINELPMFTRDIDITSFGTLNIHYIHQKSEVQNAIPLLFVHGCKTHANKTHILADMSTFLRAW